MSVPTDAAGRSRWRLAATVAVGTVIVLVGAWVISDRWEELLEAAGRIGGIRLVAGVGLSVVGILATGECWRRWLNALAPGVPAWAAHRVFYVTQAGKYVPGAVWPIMGQLSFARRIRVPKASMLAATALFLTTHVVTGAALGLLVLGSQTIEQLWWIVPTLILGGAALSPPVIRRLARTVARMRGAGTEIPSLPASVSIAAGALMLSAWLAYGLATQVLLAPFGVGAGNLPAVTGAFALSWVIGFVTVVTPAGIGAREGVLIALLTPMVGTTPALAAALLSRVAMTVGDVGLGAISATVVGEEVTHIRTMND